MARKKKLFNPLNNRLIGKYGQTRVYGTVTTFKSWRANVRDLINYLLSMRTWTLLTFIATIYVTSFLVFGAIWHGIQAHTNSCLVEVDTFAEAFLFSVETQTTIGYGTKHVAGLCEGGIIVLLFQVICGKLLDAVLIGLIFSRLSRPNNRLFTLRCSKKAVVCRRDGENYLLIRIGDMRQRDAPLVQCETKLLLITSKTTAEGERLPYSIQKLEVDSVSNSDTPLLAIPSELGHRITKNSPLFGLSRNDLEEKLAEIVLVLNGEIGNLGLTVELRSSFLPREVLFHHRFKQVCFRQVDGSCWTDWSNFDRVVPESGYSLQSSTRTGTGPGTSPINLVPVSNVHVTFLHEHHVAEIEDMAYNPKGLFVEKLDQSVHSDSQMEEDHQENEKEADTVNGILQSLHLVQHRDSCNCGEKKNGETCSRCSSQRYRSDSFVKQKGVLEFEKSLALSNDSSLSAHDIDVTSIKSHSCGHVREDISYTV
eukprot:m.74123 g.74123  ORF g.74123 m.74123 type:complete len:481 (-) comp8440_c0_seq1:2711-4153(-)